ncbi:bacillithiol system redox-active protein YtxJ [Pricia sp. S334]|uniref:Bacillithiol system redox-active protein YtxJ n=1 Tax=Pricia mediterranea TaxID=3076079 RepID=A0ABU3LAA8_9FLAO|nr:bacillithiol system redox-active protein YtxJ [Pricia sp. S334]MDT7830675.1 bacillithiol system redox-active protein YtxJ [Pricia sp. S334]
MGLFNSIFGSKKNNGNATGRQLPWIPLTSLEQVDDIAKKSASRTQIIFKHSTTCGISRMVLNRFEKNPLLKEGGLDLYFLDLHQHRELSNKIAQRFQVLHQSPQLLVIKEGRAVDHGSHGGITTIPLKDYL